MNPPEAIESERSVLACAMISPEAVGEVVSNLTPDDFCDPRNRMVSQAVADVHQSGGAVDSVTVIQRLRSTKNLTLAGGAAYITDLYQETFSTANLQTYIKAVKDAALCRAVQVAARDLAAKAETTADGAALIDQGIADLSRLATRASMGGPQTMSDVMRETVKGLEARLEGKISDGSVKTKFYSLDKLLGGMYPGQVVILAARPSIGKTALALVLANNISAYGPVLIFSLEMDRRELAERLIAHQSGVDSGLIRRGGYTQDVWKKLYDASGKLYESSIHIDDTPTLTPTQMLHRARRLKARGGLVAVFVDYLQLMSPDKQGQSRVYEVTDISRNMKLLARELELPVVVLSQLNRQLEYRTDKRPTLADLRDSGAIEQDADIVLAMYRDEIYNEFTDMAGICEVIVRKNRSGPTGTTYLRYKPETNTFLDLDERASEQVDEWRASRRKEKKAA